MKDKLIKTGKTKSYYVMRNALLSLAFILLALLLLSIPIGITYSVYLKSLHSGVQAEAIKEAIHNVAKIIQTR